MTPNQLRHIQLYPHHENAIRGAVAGTDYPPAKTSLPICTHRGNLLDTTTCRCKVYACKIHGTCSNNRRAGLTVCPCESYQAVPPA